jgi:hypothetical protein
MPAAAAEFAYVLQNPGLNFVCGGGGVRLKQAHQALVSKFLIVDVSGLGDAVGVKNQAVSDSQLGSAEGESLGWENAEPPPPSVRRWCEPSWCKTMGGLCPALTYCRVRDAPSRWA